MALHERLRAVGYLEVDVFEPNGDFHLAPPGGWEELAELWRHTVLRRLRETAPSPTGKSPSCKSGATVVFPSMPAKLPLAADNAAGRRRLAEYLLRAPFSREKITCKAAAGSVF